VRIGFVARCDPPSSGETSGCDAALVRVGDNIELNNSVNEVSISGTPRDLSDADPAKDVKVQKRGVNGHTTGWLEPTLKLHRITLEHPGAPPLVYEAEGYYVMGAETVAFAKGGDSGATVTDEDGCVVGVVIGLRSTDPMNPDPADLAIVAPITEVLERLGVEIAGTPRRCTVV